MELLSVYFEIRLYLKAFHINVNIKEHDLPLIES